MNINNRQLQGFNANLVIVTQPSLRLVNIQDIQTPMPDLLKNNIVIHRDIFMNGFLSLIQYFPARTAENNSPYWISNFNLREPILHQGGHRVRRMNIKSITQVLPNMLSNVTSHKKKMRDSFLTRSGARPAVRHNRKILFENITINWNSIVKEFPKKSPHFQRHPFTKNEMIPRKKRTLNSDVVPKATFRKFPIFRKSPTKLVFRIIIKNNIISFACWMEIEKAGSSC